MECAANKTDKNTYDENNRLLEIRKNNVIQISYAYDKAGRITKVTASGKTTVYSYDKAGNRVSLNETYTSPQPS